ncbi:MAG: hypothetical protein ACK528_00040, partial [Alphaproteobacteria bacterium]
MIESTTQYRWQALRVQVAPFNRINYRTAKLVWTSQDPNRSLVAFAAPLTLALWALDFDRFSLCPLVFALLARASPAKLPLPDQRRKPHHFFSSPLIRWFEPHFLSNSRHSSKVSRS